MFVLDVFSPVDVPKAGTVQVTNITGKSWSNKTRGDKIVCYNDALMVKEMQRLDCKKS